MTDAGWRATNWIVARPTSEKATTDANGSGGLVSRVEVQKGIDQFDAVINLAELPAYLSVCFGPDAA
jgi:hypothetical protein